MSDDEIRRLMDFILKQRAIFSSDMIDLRNETKELKAATFRQGENIDKPAAVVRHLNETTERLADEAELNRREMRHAIDNLIIGNEATRELANKAAQLAINVS